MKLFAHQQSRAVMLALFVLAVFHITIELRFQPPIVAVRLSRVPLLSRADCVSALKLNIYIAIFYVRVLVKTDSAVPVHFLEYRPLRFVPAIPQRRPLQGPRPTAHTRFEYFHRS